MNPLAYLLVSLQFTSLMLVAVFLIAYFNFGRRKYVLLWAMAFAVATVQWLLNVGSNIFFTSYEGYWLSVSLMSIVPTTLALAGHRLRVGLRNPAGWYAASAAVTGLATAWFTLADVHVGLRTGIVPLYTALMMSVLTATVLHNPRRAQPAEWGLAVVALCFALCEFAAAGAALMGGAAGTPAAQSLYQSINFLGLPAIYTGLGLFTVLIIASDMAKEMRELALSDSLTGVRNLRGFQAAASEMLINARRRCEPLSIIICDLDHFKGVNDQLGHAAGDEVLRQFAERLRQLLRPADVLARIGGEEFAILAANTSPTEAARLAERLCEALPTTPVTVKATSLEITASFGVATLRSDDADAESLLARADAALYQSKYEGRNRVTVSA